MKKGTHRAPKAATLHFIHSGDVWLSLEAWDTMPKARAAQNAYAFHNPYKPFPCVIQMDVTVTTPLYRMLVRTVE